MPTYIKLLVIILSLLDLASIVLLYWFYKIHKELKKAHGPRYYVKYWYAYNLGTNVGWSSISICTVAVCFLIAAFR